MNLKNEINTSTLTAILLFANTPNYVYKNFRKDAAVRALTNKYSTEQLVEEYHRYISTQVTEDIVIAYSILISLTFLDYHKALETFDKIDISRLTWGNEIKEIFISNAKTTNVFEVSPKISLNPLHSTKSSSNTQFQNIAIQKERHHD